MTTVAWSLPLLGGVLIGAATAALFLLNGRVAGISGILDGVLPGERRDASEWRWLFLGGLLAGGLLARVFAPETLGVMGTSVPVLAGAGLLVGFGTRLGGGCTSGHGVFGISRGSVRSFAATGTFMIVAMAVVFLVRHGAAR
jgi:uncharacterized membrane protein YedE/YeeE